MQRTQNASTVNLALSSKATSRYDFKRKPMSTTNVSAAGRHKSYALEMRCVKHSARITSSRYKADLENLQCEQLMWQQTFDAMEGLTKLKQKDYMPFTTLNNSPYHCGSLSRSYKVFHGKLSHAEGGSMKGIPQPVKELKVSPFCRCIAPIVPEYRNPYEGLDRSLQEFLSTPKENKHEVLDFGVIVWWDDRKHTAETACEFLHRFGNLLFTFYVDRSTLMAFFDNMKSAYRAVNYPYSNSGITANWNDKRLYNYSYFRSVEHENVGANAALTDLLALRYRIRNASDVRDVKTILQMKNANF
ncbi:hypothetical protein BsWGS_15018 [Bradybaena similaris]